VSEIQ